MRSNARHQCTQGLKVLIFSQFPGAGQIFMDQGDGPAYVAHFMGNGGHHNARAGQHLMEARFFVRPQVFRGIQDHGCQPGSGTGDVGREPNVGLEDLSVGPAPAALHRRAKGLAVTVQGGHVDQRGQVIADGQAGKRTGFQAEKAVCRVVGEQNAAVGAGGNDGCGLLSTSTFSCSSASRRAVISVSICRMCWTESLRLRVDLVHEQSHAEKG